MRDRTALLLAIILLLVLALLLLWPARAWPAGHRVTEATQNVYRANPGPAIRQDVNQAMDHASVVRLQEVYPGRPAHAVRRVLNHRPHWRSVLLGRVEVPILWDARVWSRVGPPRALLLTGRRPVRGWPPRFLGSVALELRATGRVVTVANVHPLPAYCRPTTYRATVRQADARTHWRDVRAWTARQRATHPGRPILLGGDFNCRLSVRTFPWFPGRALAPDYRFDWSGSIDRLITARTARHPVGLRRWSMAALADHRLQLRTLRVR